MNKYLFLLLALGNLNSSDDATSSTSSHQPKIVVEAVADSLTEQKFASVDGWVGADGAYTVQLQDGRVIWLYSDTFVGRIRDGKREECVMINNSVGIQKGWGEEAQIEYIYRQDEQGNPKSFIVPDDGQGFYWLQDSALIDGRLFLFLTQIVTTPEGGAFGFRQIGTWLGIVENPDEHPLEWKITQKKIPHVRFTENYERPFGAATVQHDGFLYIYGLTIEKKQTGVQADRHLVLARVPLTAVDAFDQWQFLSDGEWQSDPEKVTGLVPEMASEGSVTYLPGIKKYVLIYNALGFFPPILSRTADHPEGPWSEAVTIYECPDFDGERGVFTYAAKGRRIPITDNELLISYATNASSIWVVAADAKLYFPRFVHARYQIKQD